MEKKIIIKMNTDKSIVVLVNDEEKMKINEHDKTINANDIYLFIDHHKDDTYTVESVNDTDRPQRSLDFFTEIIKDITERISK